MKHYHDIKIRGTLRDLVLFVQFKKREKYPWRSVTFSKVAILLKVTLLHGCFSRFLNFTNSTKSRNAPHIADHIPLKQTPFKKYHSSLPYDVSKAIENNINKRRCNIQRKKNWNTNNIQTA